MILTFLMVFIKFLIKIYLFIYNILMPFRHMSVKKSDGVYALRVLEYERVKPVKRDRLPLPRSGHRIVCDLKNLYSFGGYNPLIVENQFNTRDEDEFDVNSFPLFQELWRFNFATKCWSRYSGRQCLPQELASNAVIRDGNCLMVYSCVYGGTGSPFGDRCSNQLYICPLNEKNGTMLEIQTTGQHPLPQYGQALIYHNNYIYTIGGTTGFSFTCDIHRLNMLNKVWEAVYIGQGQTDIEPEGRYRHEVAFDGSNIYILGGGTSDEVYNFYEIPTFNIETRQWHMTKTKPHCKDSVYSFPEARRCHGGVQMETGDDIHVFISGGYDGVMVFDDLWRLELSTMKWTRIEKCVLPQPTYFHSAAIAPTGKMYIFGGIYATGDITRSNDIYSAWLCIPKLSEICWEALVFYRPQLASYSRKKLMDIGLPNHFIDRLEI